MKSLRCPNCGSSSFHENNGQYICNYCGTKYIEPSNTIYQKMLRSLRKRSALYVSLLLIIIAIGTYIYFRLQNVEDKLDQISTTSLKSTIAPRGSVRKNGSPFIDTDPSNPFADLIVQVGGDVGERSPLGILDKAIAHYVTLENNKAFYLSLDSDGHYAYGFSSQARTIAEAEKEARQECQKNRKRHKVSASCIPYAVNDKISRMILDRK